jgi:hypothetical protein
VIDRDTHACGRVGYARAGTRTVGEKRISFFFAETLLKLLFNGYLTLSTPRNI